MQSLPAVDNQEFHKATCTSCGGKIEFPASAGGMTVECPHCHQQTELRQTKRASRGISRLLIFSVLGVGLAVGVVAILKSKRPQPAENPPPTIATTSNAAPAVAEPARPKAVSDLKLEGKVTVEKAKGGSRLTYAMGTLKNDSDHQRYGVKVQLDLFDQSGNKLPTQANDYVQTLEPRKSWSFRALIVDTKVVTAKVASITEEP